MDQIVVGTAITSTAALVGGEKDWNYNGSQESGNYSRKGPAGENLEANPIATIQSADRYENQIYPAAKLDKHDDASDYEKGVIEKCNKIGDAGYNEEVETSNLCGDDKSKGATENFSRDHVSNLESVSCLSELQVKSETCNLCGNEEKYMFVTVGNLCRALVFKCCPISIVKVPEKWFLDAMNMTLDIMIGKIKCSVEKELLENFHENHLKLDEKCLGYVMSTLDALYTMQKLGFKFDCQNLYQNLYQLLSSLSKLEGDLEDLDMIRNINWEENAKKLNFVLREGLKLDNKMAVCFTESQSRSHLLKWFILCFELCHCETKLFCKEAFDGLDELTQNSLSRLISTLRISPELHSVVFIPDTKVNLAITGAICFLKVVVNDSQVVEVIQRPTDLQCSQLVLSPKGLGTALVTDYDIGIAPPLASSDVVQVAEIAWIKIMSLEVISLMEGHAQTIDMMAGISGDRTFDSYQFAYNSAQVQVKDQIIEMSNTGGGNINVPKVKIFASHLGITTFFVNALQQSGHEILSQPIMMEVYAGPEIHLHDIFLVPGASYVLTLQGTPGAPTFGVNVEFTSLELLQNEYHIDPIDVEAVIAITIVQLYSKEAALIYKKLNMMTRSAYEFVEMWRKGVESDQIPCLQALEVILVECSAALDPWMFVVVSKVLMFTAYGIKDVRASHLSCMRNINAPDQFVKPIRSTANGKAMMELNMGLYTDIGLHDFSLDSQSPTLGFELLFAKMKFRKVLCMKLYMVASGATTQGHMLHDKVIEFSSQLNQANSCTALGKYGHAEMKRLEQEINIEKCVALAIIPMGNTDLVSEEIEQPLFLNVIFQVLDFSAYSDNNLAILFDDVPIVGMLKTGAIDWLLIVPCLLTNGDSTPTVITWLSKLKAHSQSSSMYSSPLGNFSTATMELLSHIVLEECEWVVFKSVKNCYDDKPGEWGQFTRVVNVDTGQLSHHVEAKAYVLKATQLTNLEENDDLFLYFQHWGITLLIFYFEFVYDLFIYACFFYNNLGAAFDNTMALQRVNIVDYALGTSLNASDRYWDKMFLMLAISAVLEPQMPKITFGDLDNEAWTNFGRLFRLEVNPVL
ncbi:uncharacterized protein LOC133717348 isoform X2 [Rosa rugosa]|nr:uncharacterized protein LOC133717348 isoform X2 [Rosa rugosa]